MIATAVSHYPKVGDGQGEQKLRQAIAKFDRGELDDQGLARVADQVTVEVLRQQESAGLDLLTDGQIRWQDPLTYICSRLDGFQITGLLRWFETNTYYRQPVATGPIRWRSAILVNDFKFAQAEARKPVKAVLTGPYTIGMLSQSKSGDQSQLILEVARALNQEVRALAAAGPPWIQIDEPAIAANPSVNYPRDFGVFREAMAILTDGVPTDLSLYVYHGSAEDVPSLLDLPFKLFGFDLIQGVRSEELFPRWQTGKSLGLGLVDARNVRMESEDEVAEEAIRIALETGAPEVHLSPSCGLEFLPRDVANRKLQVVASAAHSAEVNG